MEYDGSRYIFHQSWVNQYLMCPEAGRLAAFHPQLSDSPIRETDASVLGTGTHVSIEHLLKGDDLSHARAKGIEYITTTEFRAVQTKRVETMLRDHENMVTAWVCDLWPRIGQPVMVEGSFSHDISGLCRLEGHMDFQDEWVTVDWKTASSNWKDKYAPYMCRKKIQPTVYTCARAGWDTLTSGTLPTEYFGFGIMIKGPRVEAHWVPTERDTGDWRFLWRQLERIIAMYEKFGPDEPWPMHDDGWWCSEKWCDFWWACKGRIVDVEGYKAHTAADVHVGID